LRTGDDNIWISEGGSDRRIGKKFIMRSSKVDVLYEILG
jgi:hypothetical protein